MQNSAHILCQLGKAPLADRMQSAGAKPIVSGVEKNAEGFGGRGDTGTAQPLGKIQPLHRAAVRVHSGHDAAVEV